MSEPQSYVLRPSKILGIGVNYRAHGVEMTMTPSAEPLVFMKPPSAMIGPTDSMVMPLGYERIDYEAELGGVIGTRAHRGAVADALSYVLGYTCINDVTLRDLQQRDGQWTRAKGFDRFCPIGPWIRADIDPANLFVRSGVNGVLRQYASTSEMIVSVAHLLIEYLTAVMTLEPDDVITSGTSAGAGPLTPGDVVEVEVEGIGVLRNRVAMAT